MGGCVGGSTATVVCRLAGVSCAAEMRELGFGLVGNLRPPSRDGAGRSARWRLRALSGCGGRGLSSCVPFFIKPGARSVGWRGLAYCQSEVLAAMLQWPQWRGGLHRRLLGVRPVEHLFV